MQSSPCCDELRTRYLAVLTAGLAAATLSAQPPGSGMTPGQHFLRSNASRKASRKWFRRRMGNRACFLSRPQEDNAMLAAFPRDYEPKFFIA